MVSRFFDESKVGDIDHSRERVISEGDVQRFCGFSGDWFGAWSFAHMDRDTGLDQEFERDQLHGTAIIGLSYGLQYLENPNVIVAAYGYDDIEHLRPLWIGDSIRYEFEVIAKEDRGDGTGTLSTETRIFNQHDELVLRFTTRSRTRTRENWEEIERRGLE